MIPEVLPADLLLGCVWIGGSLSVARDALVFVADAGESTAIPTGEIAEARLGGPNGADANRIDLALLDGRTVTLLVVGRDRVAERISGYRGPETGV